MPFKPGKSFNDMNRKLDIISRDIEHKKVPAAIFAAVSVGAGIAKAQTPVKTSNLINSQYISVDPVTGGWRGTVGYTAGYAAAVHAKPGTLLGDPNYWKPKAIPKFLTRAFEDNKAEIDRVFFLGLRI